MEQPGIDSRTIKRREDAKRCAALCRNGTRRHNQRAVVTLKINMWPKVETVVKIFCFLIKYLTVND